MRACSRATASRACTLTRLDRLEDRHVLVLRDDDDLPRRRQLGLHHQQEPARRGERQRHDVLERPSQLGALRERVQRPVELLVEVAVVDKRLDARVADDRLHLVRQLAQRLELVGGLQALRAQARGRALEHAPQLDRVVDVARA